MKALALLAAAVLWLAVTFLGSRAVIAEGIPVSVTNLRDDLALATTIEPVRVKLRAPRTLLRERAVGDLVRAFVDVAGRGLGAQSAEVTVVPGDPRVSVLVVLPARVDLSLDPVVQRSLPVTVVPEGEPAEGYRVGQGTADPATVQVRGALGKLQATVAIEALVPVQGATASFEGEVPLRPPDGLRPTPDRVRVQLELAQAEETKTLGVRVVTTGTPVSGYWVRTVTTDPPVVTVKGPREVLATLVSVETEPLSLSGARAALERTMSLALPERTTMVGAEPRVRVAAEVVLLEGTRDMRAAVQIGEVADGLRVATVSPGTVRVTVRGSGEAFDRLRDEDVRVALSASGKTSGTFAVRPTPELVRVPSGVQVVSVEGIDVNVTLEQ